MTTTDIEQVATRLTEAIGDGKEPYLTCNAGKQDIKDILAHVKDLERRLKVQESLNKDYLCIISYKNLILSGKFPEVLPYEQYQQRSAEFLSRSVESQSVKQKISGTPGVDQNLPPASTGV